ncbi:MAG TPA: hypothetical protein DCW46_03055 [Desulfotomaculum sp.]|nr:hypothetical protein [Desulfotomaculum sp.]
MPQAGDFGSAINFFLYNTVKILFMLVLIIFVITVIRSFFPPKKHFMARRELAAYFGIVALAIVCIGYLFNAIVRLY